MMAMTTSNSMSVNPDRLRDMAAPPDGQDDGEEGRCLILPRQYKRCTSRAVCAFGLVCSGRERLRGRLPGQPAIASGRGEERRPSCGRCSPTRTRKYRLAALWG